MRFQKFSGGIPSEPHSGWGRPPLAPNSQPGLWSCAGRKPPGVGTQTLVPLNFSAVVAPLTTTIVKPNVSKRSEKSHHCACDNNEFLPQTRQSRVTFHDLHLCLETAKTKKTVLLAQHNLIDLHSHKAGLRTHKTMHRNIKQKVTEFVQFTAEIGRAHV